MLLVNLRKNTLYAYGRTIKISCVVRNEINGWRPKQGSPDLFRTIPHNIPSMPRQFPKGKWTVGRPEARTDPYLAPYYIPTTAWQHLDIWELEDGYYKCPTGATTIDRGYGLHYSTSNTTQGCIKIMNLSDLLFLVNQIRTDIDAGFVVQLRVE